MDITFLLNGETVTLKNANPHLTCLDFIREMRSLTGTKEGCNEGDCGACTVIVFDNHTVKPLNACILFLGQLNGKAIRTVEAIGEDGHLHPVQSKLVEKHGSQCGFCTPGIVTSLVAAQINERSDYDNVIAGNLCRCTGYAPIIKAAETAEVLSQPSWLIEDREKIQNISTSPCVNLPQSSDEVAALLTAHPETCLIAGATDVGLWVTKGLQDVYPFAFLADVEDLSQIEERQSEYVFGALVTIEALYNWAKVKCRPYAELLRRYGSVQIRTAATLGGNIANGSPIGDNPPVLIAAGAELCLRQGDKRRRILLENYFLDYGRQDLKVGEFVEAIVMPKALDALRCYKVSKRFDQDISAICGCFNLEINDGVISSARIAFGGMAGIPKRASNVEHALLGKPWCLQTCEEIELEWIKDFTPLTDVRASAKYRLEVARNLLTRYFMEKNGQTADVLQVVS